MSDRRRAIAVGAVVGLAYLGLAALSGSLSPLARRPLLDGFGALPAYRWVTPPPQHSTGNLQPDSGRFVITLDPQTGVEASVYYTKDNQITMAFQNGAIGTGTGQDSIVLTFTPLDPDGFGKPPAGMTIVGNVARIQGTFRPNGDPVTGLNVPAQVVLFYPAPATTFGFNHAILRSADGRTWTPLPSTDSRGQQLVSARTESLGYFVVGEAPNTTGGTSGGIPIGTILIYVAVGGLAAFVLLQILRIELRRRRRAR
jgi:hypothetical protein